MPKRRTLALIIVAILAAVAAVPSRSSRAEPAADDCLSEPNRAPSQGTHWHYRTDRSTGRRCWYLAPQREKAAEARPVVPAKPRPTSRTTSEPQAEPPAEPIARVAEPVPDVPTQLQSPPTSVAPTESEPALARDQGAAEQSQMQPQAEAAEQVDKPSMMPTPTAGDPAAAATSDIRFEHMLVLLAVALLLTAGMVRQVVKLLVVRRLRRRRSALRSQWDAASAARAPMLPELGNTSSAIPHAEVVHDPAAAARFDDVARQPTKLRDASHELAQYGIEDRRIDEGLQRLLHDLRRAAA
jgi:hypothetical protein